ncbi:uncharacterized protein LOC133879025 [Alnus glutinosa]|uniref:uncharacterized protein LOC133879025 n=1 Tax=Alnus glutinosa TaxID=3517 RepID=UPI002D78B540|nr:uncharacterized protein LOC133879025 [Alnus glutinosa]
MDNDLWDLIEATTEPPRQEDDEAAFKAWSKKNSTALHVIQISCGPDTIFEVIQISSAKTAWDTLEAMYVVSTGIYIQPARATEEIRLNIQDIEKGRSNQIKIIGSGMTGASIQINRIPGAALQMQRELQWFKEVESIVVARSKEHLNRDGLTPRELFTKKHIDLKKEGEKWMKGTSTSCTVVGALIVTIMFAAAFTVPGGNNQDTGVPVFLDKRLFMLFIIFDALSLFSSTTSVVMFLGILTSRYAEDDFLESLPRKMIIGLSTLFFSIAAMMTAFSTALLIMLQGQYSWLVIPVICLASVPVTLFILMQFPLLVDMCMSTYGPGIFDKKMKRWV